MNGMMNKTQFDKIYVVSLISNHDRQEFIKYQMKELDIYFEFIYGIDFYNLKYYPKREKKIPINYPNVYNYSNINDQEPLAKNFGCAISHYNAVLQAYELGYNNVLIIEDDICFIKNKQLIYESLNNLPNDADFITWDPRFKSTPCDKEYNNFKKRIQKSNDYFIELPNTYRSLVGAMIYGLMNRETMKLYLDNQRNSLLAADHIWNIYQWSSVKRYVSKKCLCTDLYNIKTNFNVNDTSYKCIYKDIENLTINNFYVKENIENIFTRQNG